MPIKLHARAAPTIEQRKEIKRLHCEEGASVRMLADRFHVGHTTIQRWIKRETPLDRRSAPLKRRTTITPEYRRAVIAYCREHSGTRWPSST